MEEIPVRVAVRIRPLSPEEQVRQCEKCVAVKRGREVVLAQRRFTFDVVYDERCTQKDLFEHSVGDLVDGCLEGYNATVLAYGQTGSGKTHTMGMSAAAARLTRRDAAKSSGVGASLGVLPRVCSQLFERIEQHMLGNPDVEFSIRVVYLEIYNEMVRDLLSPISQSKFKTGKQVQIRDNSGGDVLVQGAKEVSVESLDQVIEQVELGSAYRATGSTQMNAQSSRSHAIFTILIEQKNRRDGRTRLAKFHLVDLAGSERNKRTNAVGERFQESIQINQGLLALGNVISILGDDTVDRRVIQKHVPYRQSKLTRLLRDSLGGNSRTLFVACISPADESYAETLNTLKYANRARNIKNTPIVNDALPSPHMDDDPHEHERVRQLEAEIEALMEEKKSTRVGEGVLNRVRDVRVELNNLLEVAQASSNDPDQAFKRLFLGVRRLLRSGNVPLNDQDSEGKICSSTSCESEKNSLRVELQEARGDLERDEIIFAKKVDELNTVQNHLKEVFTDREQLRVKLVELEEENRQLLLETPQKGFNALDSKGSQETIRSPESFVSAFGERERSSSVLVKQLQNELMAKDLALAEVRSRLKRAEDDLDQVKSEERERGRRDQDEIKELRSRLSASEHTLQQTKEYADQAQETVLRHTATIKTLQHRISQLSEESNSRSSLELNDQALASNVDKTVESSLNSCLKAYHAASKLAKNKEQMTLIGKSKKDLEQSLGKGTVATRIMELSSKLLSINKKIQTSAKLRDTFDPAERSRDQKEPQAAIKELLKEKEAIRNEIEGLSAEETLNLQHTMDSIEHLREEENFTKVQIQRTVAEVSNYLTKGNADDLSTILSEELLTQYKVLPPPHRPIFILALSKKISSLVLEKSEFARDQARLRVDLKDKDVRIEMIENKSKVIQIEHEAARASLVAKIKALELAARSIDDSSSHFREKTATKTSRKLDQEYIANLKGDIKFYLNTIADLKAKAQHMHRYYSERAQMKDSDSNFHKLVQQQAKAEQMRKRTCTPSTPPRERQTVRVPREALQEISLEDVRSFSDRRQVGEATSSKNSSPVTASSYAEAMEKALAISRKNRIKG